MKYNRFRPVLKDEIVQKTCKLLYKKLDIFFSPSIRMKGKTINFDDKKINNSNFYKNKKSFKIAEIDANTILVSKKITLWHKNIN